LSSKALIPLKKEHIDEPIGLEAVMPFVVIPTLTMTAVNENK